MTRYRRLGLGFSLISAFLLGGCATVNTGNSGQMQSYAVPVIEAEWIRNGEPIQYDGLKWYPVNDFEVLEDADVFQIAEYKGVQVFVEKIETKPYGRIYTKFDKNRFRYWEPKEDDQS